MASAHAERRMNATDSPSCRPSACCRRLRFAGSVHAVPGESLSSACDPHALDALCKSRTCTGDQRSSTLGVLAVAWSWLQHPFTDQRIDCAEYAFRVVKPGLFARQVDMPPAVHDVVAVRAAPGALDVVRLDACTTRTGQSVMRQHYRLRVVRATR